MIIFLVIFNTFVCLLSVSLKYEHKIVSLTQLSSFLLSQNDNINFGKDFLALLPHDGKDLDALKVDIWNEIMREDVRPLTWGENRSVFIFDILVYKRFIL